MIHRDAHTKTILLHTGTTVVFCLQGEHVPQISSHFIKTQFQLYWNGFLGRHTTRKTHPFSSVVALLCTYHDTQHHNPVLVYTLARESASVVLPDFSRLSLSPSPCPLDRPSLPSLPPLSLLSTPLLLLLPPPPPPSPVEPEVLTTRPPREEPVVLPDPDADATLESTLLPLDSRPTVARALVVDDCLDDAPVAAAAAPGADEGLEVDEVVEGFELPLAFEAVSEEEEEAVAGFRTGFESLGANARFTWRGGVRGGGGGSRQTVKDVFQALSDTTIISC